MTYFLLSSGNLQRSRLSLGNFIIFFISLENVTNITCISTSEMQNYKATLSTKSWGFVLVVGAVSCNLQMQLITIQLKSNSEGCHVMQENKKVTTSHAQQSHLAESGLAGEVCWTPKSMNECLDGRSYFSCFILLLRVFILEHLILHIFPSL